MTPLAPAGLGARDAEGRDAPVRVEGRRRAEAARFVERREREFGLGAPLEEGAAVAAPALPYPPRFDGHGHLSFALGADPVTAGAAGSSAGVDDNPQRITYKDVVERYAAECDVVFMPTSRTRGDGGRVFQFGSASIAIDTKENLVWMQESSSKEWLPNPVDLETLKKAAK